MPGTGVSPLEKRDPPQLPNIFGERYCIGVDVCRPAPVPALRWRRGGAFGGDLAVFSIGTYDDSHVFLDRVDNIVGNINKSSSLIKELSS